MSVSERREAVRALVTHGLSVQRACVLVQLQRASFHYQPRPAADDGVTMDITVLAQAHPRYGYRRIWALLRRKRTINRKRVHRLWKRARLQIKRPKGDGSAVSARCPWRRPIPITSGLMISWRIRMSMVTFCAC